ncbi:hypothetical protein [Rathayibacter festucae]|uniref:Uncharacterized protein n=1 Tax=Rathayibacter festucae DSM 15932 TaxID=1328866 RepID=A0A3Q9UYN5_9MICO|nr:hypothetical protein [Rathayibacter festucae]AZZ51442.1 hypothetical protein C1I64_04885 [Rathayibacter festucae DSM 15932]
MRKFIQRVSDMQVAADDQHDPPGLAMLEQLAGHRVLDSEVSVQGHMRRTREIHRDGAGKVIRDIEVVDEFIAPRIHITTQNYE